MVALDYRQVDHAWLMNQVLEHLGVEFDSNRTGNQKILCPVHEEHRPSAVLSLDEGLFCCHACQAAGTAFDLLMKREGIDFASAVRRAEEITGDSGQQIRDKHRPGKAVSPGQGYQPRYRKKVSPRARRRASFGT